ncbi:MAG: ACT domain-containing protein [Syntrophobacteraceae bacterium]
MKVEQISIFMENKPGALERVAEVLGKANINIRALSLADTSDFGILRLIVNDIATAQQVLQEKGFTVKRTDVVAVEVPDRPSGLHEILAVLSENKINVEYMYAFIEQSGENAIIIFRFNPTDAAIKVLLKNGYSIMPGEKIYGL